MKFVTNFRQVESAQQTENPGTETCNSSSLCTSINQLPDLSQRSDGEQTSPPVSPRHTIRKAKVKLAIIVTNTSELESVVEVALHIRRDEAAAGVAQALSRGRELQRLPVAAVDGDVMVASTQSFIRNMHLLLTTVNPVAWIVCVLCRMSVKVVMGGGLTHKDSLPLKRLLPCFDLLFLVDHIGDVFAWFPKIFVGSYHEIHSKACGRARRAW